jgi:Ca2+-binding EF-hand superfamily protein
MVNWSELPRLNEEELEMCRKAFVLFDKDGRLLYITLLLTQVKIRVY